MIESLSLHPTINHHEPGRQGRRIIHDPDEPTLYLKTFLVIDNWVNPKENRHGWSRGGEYQVNSNNLETAIFNLNIAKICNLTN